MSPEEKKKQLYLRQKNMLDLFSERHAIDQKQYDKCLAAEPMLEKMDRIKVKYGLVECEKLMKQRISSSVSKVFAMTL